MSSKHFLAKNNKLLEKNYLAETLIESKIKAKVNEKDFLEYLLARKGCFTWRKTSQI